MQSISPIKLNHNVGVDILRILSCIGVLVYHIANIVCVQTDYELTESLVLYFIASFCVPMFFIISGYSVFIKDSISFEYLEKKTYKLLKVLILWYIFFIALNFLQTGNLLNIVDNIYEGFFSSGILPTAWFMFSLIIINILFVYPLSILFYKFPKIYIILGLAVLVGLGVKKYFMFKGEITTTSTQSLWFYIYIPYYWLGGIFAYMLKHIDNEKISGASWIFFIVTTAYYLYKVLFDNIFIPPSNYYGTFIYTIWIISMFLCFATTRYNKNIQILVLRISQNTMCIYLAHLPILRYITQKIQITAFGEVIAAIFLLFIFCNLLAELLRNIPVFRHMV